MFSILTFHISLNTKLIYVFRGKLRALSFFFLSNILNHIKT